MAKFYGNIGFARTYEKTEGGIPTGVWVDEIEEKRYYGELLKRNYRYASNPDSINDNVDISHELSIISNDFAVKNLAFIRYVELHNTKWKVNNIVIEYPRLILTLGGVYNEE